MNASKIRLALLSLLAVVVFALAMALPQPAQAQGCPMCKKALESSIKDGSKPVGRGINSAILFLMVVPFAAVGTVGGAYYMKMRKMNQD